MGDYDIEIVSKSKKDNGKVFKIFDVADEGIVGVTKNEPFMLRFINNTSEKVQVRLSLDGTDILTGDIASTKPKGKMWLVQAHDVLELSAWPETSEGGARFVFTDEEKGVAINTHGNIVGQGLIGAAVYRDYNQANWFNNGHHISTRRFTKSSNVGMVGSSAGDITFSASNIRFNTCGYRSSGHDAVPVFESSDNDLAVGAGERVEQQLETAKGLSNPVLDEIVQVRYMSWSKLNKLIVKEIKTKSSAFPGDSITGIDLKNVPKVRSSGKNKTLVTVQERFA